MFGLRIVSKDYLNNLEKEVQELSRIAEYRARELNKTRNFFRTIVGNSKKMNKNEIVEMCKELLKEMR